MPTVRLGRSVHRQPRRQLRYLPAELVSSTQQSYFWRPLRCWRNGRARILARGEVLCVISTREHGISRGAAALIAPEAPGNASLFFYRLVRQSYFERSRHIWLAFWFCGAWLMSQFLAPMRGEVRRGDRTKRTARGIHLSPRACIKLAMRNWGPHQMEEPRIPSPRSTGAVLLEEGYPIEVGDAIRRREGNGCHDATSGSWV